MSEQTQIPPVIDLDALLAPIDGENSAGDSLRYSGMYDEIAEARRADDVLNQGAWTTELKTADYKKVVSVATNALTTLSKDLQIAAWLSEALIKLHGFAGLRDSLKLMAGLHENFWDGAFPLVEDNDQEGRANAVSWLETNGSVAIKGAAITGGPGLSYNDWVDAKRFDIPANIENLDSDAQQRWTDLRNLAEKENRTTAEKWKSALAQTKRAACEQIETTISECWEAFGQLNSVIEEKYESKQMPGLSALKKALDEVHSQSKKILEKKRQEEPDAADTSEGWSTDDGWTATDADAATGGGGGGGPLRNRPEALRRLEEVADYFTRTEPHSPVAYLVQRAVKWGNMPLDSWLADVVKDENVLGQIRETLGLSGGGGSFASDAGWGDGAPDAAVDETPTEATSDEW